MNTWKRRIALAWFALGVLTLLVTVSTEARAQTPAVDPAAVQILKRMTDFLDGLQQFSVNTQNILEELHVSGHRVDYDLSASVTVKRPNKLRAVRTGELTNQRFFYDGKTLTLYNPIRKGLCDQRSARHDREDDRPSRAKRSESCSPPPI